MGTTNTPRDLASPNLRRLERAYARALAAELAAVDALPEVPTRTEPSAAVERQRAHCRKLAERTNAALRALNAARGGAS